MRLDQRAERQLVVAANHRGWPLRRADQRPHGGPAVGDAVGAFREPAGIEPQPVLGQALQHAPLARICAVVAVGHAGDQADVGVAKPDEMIRHGIGGRDIVDADARPTGGEGPGLDDRHAVLRNQRQQPRIVVAADQHQPIDTARQQQPDLVELGARLVVRAGEQQRVAGALQAALQGGDGGREADVLDGRDDGTDRHRPAGGEGARGTVRYVAQRLASLLDLEPHVRADGGDAVQHARYARRRNPRIGGDVVEADARAGAEARPSPADGVVHTLFLSGAI